jgi:hypothetical protein
MQDRPVQIIEANANSSPGRTPVYAANVTIAAIVGP